MTTKLIEIINLFRTSDDEFSPLQEAMVRVHLENLSRPIIQIIGLVVIFFVGGVAEFLQLVYDEQQQQIVMRWRLYICIIIAVYILILSLVERAKHWINLLFAFFYGMVCFISGYYLSQVRTPHSAAMYVIYIIPLISVVLPARFLKRTVITFLSLLLIPGMILSLGWPISLLTIVSSIMIGASCLSVILGHTLFYRLNRQAFFRDRQLAQQRQQIQFLAEHDQLTGLYNRRIFEERLEDEFARARRYDLSMSLIMIDLDHFKNINDTYGHKAGDTVLEAMGEILLHEANQQVRESDVPGRYGGEEFCLLLPETRLEGASIVANRIRDELKSRAFETSDGKQFEVTCSIGVSELTEAMENSDDFVREADEALYEAKNEGRDQVVLA